MQPVINGIEPSWANLTVTIAGMPVTGITKIDYTDKQEVANIYGWGQSPIGRGYGNITPSCSITLLRSEIEAIRTSSKTGRLQDIAPFDIIVTFIPTGGTKVTTHKIRNCQFTSDSLSMGQGDTKNETTFELLPSSIEWK